MVERETLLIQLAEDNAPCTVRQLYYRALVAGMPGVDKSKAGYKKVQDLCLQLRRSGRMPWRHIVDTSRSVYRVDQWSSLDEFLGDVALSYRRSLWDHAPCRVEVWCESESIASTIMQVTSRWRVTLCPTRGHPSESLMWAASQSYLANDKQTAILYIGDHDPAGLSIEQTMLEKIDGFTGGTGLYDFRRVGVTWAQVEEYDLPGLPPKKPYGYPKSVEAEALPPDLLRSLLDEAIREFVDLRQVELLQEIEQEEIRTLFAFKKWQGLAS
jgi:hypothetical protein